MRKLKLKQTNIKNLNANIPLYLTEFPAFSLNTKGHELSFIAVLLNVFMNELLILGFLFVMIVIVYCLWLISGINVNTFHLIIKLQTYKKK